MLHLNLGEENHRFSFDVSWCKHGTISVRHFRFPFRFAPFCWWAWWRLRPRCYSSSVKSWSGFFQVPLCTWLEGFGLLPGSTKKFLKLRCMLLLERPRTWSWKGIDVDVHLASTSWKFPPSTPGSASVIAKWAWAAKISACLDKMTEMVPVTFWSLDLLKPRELWEPLSTCSILALFPKIHTSPKVHFRPDLDNQSLCTQCDIDPVGSQTQWHIGLCL